MILTRKKLTELYNDENFITLFEFNWYRHFQNEKSIRDLKSNVLKVQKYFRYHHCSGV